MSVASDIHKGMAVRLWAVAWRDYWNRTDPDTQDDLDAHPVPLVPKAANKAAADLAKLYEHLNGVSLEHALHELLRPRKRRIDPDSFGTGLASASIGDPDYSMFGETVGVKVPSFEVWYDGVDMWWEGDDGAIKDWGPPQSPQRNASIEDDLGINPPRPIGHRQDSERGRRWAKSLSPSQLHDFIDHQVLGEFDWRDWGFESKPPAAFMNAAFAEAQLREDVESNPGRFTEKGERMYQDIKATYESEGESRAAELAARTVYARSKEVPGLLRVGMGRPPGVPNRSRR